jgi:hypothetical protein
MYYFNKTDLMIVFAIVFDSLVSGRLQALPST